MARLRFPSPFVLLTLCIALAAVLTWILPAGRYERRDDPATGRSVVVAGTYHPVPARPVGAFEAVVAIPKGLEAAADVVFLVFLVGGAFAVVEQTGVLHRVVASLVRRLGQREAIVIPVVAAAFALGGVLENMQEEIIAFVPLLLLLVRQLGFDPLTAVAMSAGAAAVGAAFSPINPFQVGIAQQLAQLPPLSGALFRTAFLLAALALWTWGTIRWAMRHRRLRPAEAEAADADAPLDTLGGRHLLVLAAVLASFVMLGVGILRLGWGFDELSALFFVMGVLVGLVSGMGVDGTAAAFIEGFRSMASAALLIGFARAITLVLDQGQVLDTLVHGLALPLDGLPVGASALGMMAMHGIIHVPVPSVSGQAVLTMPILVPLSDLLGLHRQVTVLAYQYGAGLTDLITPTNGGLMAILAASGVGFGDWLRFALRWTLFVAALGAGAVLVAIAIGLR